MDENVSGKTAIINKILTDGDNLAKSFLDEGEQKREQTINAALVLARDYETRKKAEIEAESAAIIRRKESAADIEVKKLLLQKKQEIITDVMEMVRKNLKKDENGYKKLLISLVTSSAEDGDEVIVSKEDGKLLTKSAVEKIAAEKGIRLGYFDGGDISGGVILKSGNFDKNLSTDIMLKQIRQDYITQISKILFGRE